MKEIMFRIPAYFAFDRPLEIRAITTTFTKTHEEQQKIIPNWGIDSTRQMLISKYWFTDVKGHFAAILGLSVLLTLLVAHSFDKYTLVEVLITAIYSFLVLIFCIYLPMYTSDFLPKLNSIKTLYESTQQREIIKELQAQLSIQQEQIAQQQQLFQNELNVQYLNQQQLFQVALQQELADQETRISKQEERTQRRFLEKISEEKAFIEKQQEEKQKCREAQLSNFALVLIYCVLAKLAGKDAVKANNKTAILLQKLYGKDSGGLFDNLVLVAGTKKSSPEYRHLTELRTRFKEAVRFFEEMDFPKGVMLLNELEIKILGS